MLNKSAWAGRLMLRPEEMIIEALILPDATKEARATARQLAAEMWPSPEDAPAKVRDALSRSL